MAHLIFILVAFALLGGFFALTSYEARRGARLFARARSRLDQGVARMEFVLEHVDLGAFLREEVRRVAARMSHSAANLSLQAVRAVERFLTRLVRYLRSRNTVDAPPRESTRTFVKTLSDFKDRLKKTHPEISDIQQPR